MPLVERIVLPPEDPRRLGGALAALTTGRAHGAALVGPDGEQLDLPPEVFEIFREVVEALAQGLYELPPDVPFERLPVEGDGVDR